jgi:hypothetical protein
VVFFVLGVLAVHFDSASKGLVFVKKLWGSILMVKHPFRLLDRLGFASEACQ